ncbi:unnamed protein product, partial [Musa hybrid cultivar]
SHTYRVGEASWLSACLLQLGRRGDGGGSARPSICSPPCISNVPGFGPDGTMRFFGREPCISSRWATAVPAVSASSARRSLVPVALSADRTRRTMAATQRAVL